MIEENPAAATFFFFQINATGSILPIPTANFLNNRYVIPINLKKLICRISTIKVFFLEEKHFMSEIFLIFHH